MGCQKGNKCPHAAHETLPGLGKLNYSVAMQIIRRGGLKGGPRIDLKEVDGRVAQLRAQAAAEKSEKMQPKNKAKAKPKPKARAGKGDSDEKAGQPDWEVPEDFQVPLTQLEEDLEEAAQGPDPAWLEVPSHEHRPEAEPNPEQLSTEEQERLIKWRKLLEGGLFQPLKEPSEYLQSHVVARILAAEDSQQECDLLLCLEEAVERGRPALAEEATRHLEDLKHDPKAGHKAHAEFSVPTWTDE